MIIVCDTNVLVSALVFPGGIPDKIIHSIISGRFQHATSPDILTEFRKVLLNKLNIDRKKVDSLISLITQISQLTYPTERISIIKEDETDNRILECAVTVKAQYIITGDQKHLLPLKTYEGIIIITPREFAQKVGLV